MDICVKLGRVKQKQNKNRQSISDMGLTKGICWVFDELKQQKSWLLKEQMKREVIVFDQQVACTFLLELTTHTAHFTEKIDLSVFEPLKNYFWFCHHSYFSIRFLYPLLLLEFKLRHLSFLSDFLSPNRVSNQQNLVWIHHTMETEECNLKIFQI